MDKVAAVVAYLVMKRFIMDWSHVGTTFVIDGSHVGTHFVTEDSFAMLSSMLSADVANFCDN